MKRVLLGTMNRAKLESVSAVLTPLGIAVEMPRVPLEVAEGDSVQENARRKARAYAKFSRLPVLAIDNALYLEGLPDAEQPGPHVRRIPGVAGRASDEAMLAYYRALLRRLGERVRGYWVFAICLVAGGREFETLTRVPREFVSTPGATLLPGYPLESLQLDPRSGMYVSELPLAAREALWRELVGEAVQSVVARALR